MSTTTYAPNVERPLYRMCYLCKGIEGPRRLLEPLPDHPDLLACPGCTKANTMRPAIQGPS